MNDFQICLLSFGLHLMLTEASLKWSLGHTHSPKSEHRFQQLWCRCLMRQMFVPKLGRMNIPDVRVACNCQVLIGGSAAGNFTFRKGAAAYTQYLEFSWMSNLSTTNIPATPWSSEHCQKLRITIWTSTNGWAISGKKQFTNWGQLINFMSLIIIDMLRVHWLRGYKNIKSLILHWCSPLPKLIAQVCSSFFCGHNLIQNFVAHFIQWCNHTFHFNNILLCEHYLWLL